jgi:hypothetical protein
MQQHRAGAIEQEPDRIPPGAGEFIAGGEVLGTEFNGHGLGHWALPLGGLRLIDIAAMAYADNFNS